MGLAPSNNTYNADLCEMGTLISEDVALLLCLSVKVLLSIFGVVVLPIVLFKEKLSAFFHKNARELFRFHVTLVVVAAVGTIGSDGLDLLRFTVIKWFSRDEKCPVSPMYSSIAVTLRLVKMFGMSGCTHAFVACGIERIYATVMARTYDVVNDKIGIFLSFIAFVCTCAGVFVVGYFSDKDIFMPMTVIPPKGIRYSLTLLYVDASAELLTVIVLGILWMLNCRRGRTSDHIRNSLSFKFQTRENVSASALLFPLCLLHCAFQLTQASVQPVLLMGERNQVKRTRLVGFMDIIPFYNAALPLVMLWRIRVRQRGIDRLMANNLIGKFSSGKKDADKLKSKHFEILENMFK